MIPGSARGLRRRAAAASLLVAALLAGCSDGGGGGDAGESSVDEFCSALAGFRDDVGAADSTDLVAYIRTLKAAADEVGSVGVPNDMPSEAQQGLDLTIERIQGLADDASQEDVAQLGDVSDEEQRTLDALEDYIKQACPDLTSSAP